MRRSPLRQRLGAAFFELMPRSFRRAALALSGRQARSIYDGARYSRLELDWIASTIAADEEVKRDSRRLRARARELSRNNALAKHYLRLLGTNVIGPRGFKHQAQVRDNSSNLNDRLNDRIEEAFADWAQEVTLDRRLSLVRLEHQLLRTVACDGEAFARFWRVPENAYGLALEPIDADSVDENLNAAASRNSAEIRMGVEVDAYKRPVAYWTRSTSGDQERIPADQVLHLYDPDRVNQTRGVTWFHSVMLPLKFLGAYIETELVASRASAAKVAMFQRRAGQLGEDISASGTKPMLEELSPGTQSFVPDGYELADWDPQHPTAAFGDFIKNCQREIATGLGVSYEALTTDLADATYSSMKAGRQNERDIWRTLQEWWIGSFRRQVYREWMTQALLTGTYTGGAQGLVLDSRPLAKLLAVKWGGRGWLSPDPLKDMNAAVLAIENGLGSRHTYLAEAGEDWEETVEALAREAEDAEAAGVSVSSAQAKADAAAALATAAVEENAAATDRAARKSPNGKTHDNAVLIGAD